MPPRFSQLNTTAAAPAAAAQPAMREPEVLTAQVENTEAPTTSALSIYDSATAGAALLAVVAESESGASNAPPFPTIVVSGGNTGGAFEAMKGTPEDVRDILPEGRKPIPCILLGYRTHLFAWAAAASDKASGGDGKPSRPVWACNVPASNAEDYKLITKALNNYTFKKKHEKAAYDFDREPQVGHLKAQFQALVYLPATDSLAVIQGLGLYKSWVNSCGSVSKLVDAKGGFIKAPISAHVQTVDEKGSEAWKLHSLCFQLALPTNVSREEIGAKFLAFVQRMQGDEQANSKVLDWLNAVDHTITDDIRAKLKASLSL